MKYRKPEYIAWTSMRSRCNCKTNAGYHRYGGRGISVCERWESSQNFLDDMGPRPTSEHSLDRINNEGNYEPSNCRWATRLQQANNQSRCYVNRAAKKRFTTHVTLRSPHKGIPTVSFTVLGKTPKQVAAIMQEDRRSEEQTTDASGRAS